MSIPTRFSVLCTDGTTFDNETLGTLSYGVDTRLRETWERYFRRGLKAQEGFTPEQIEKWCPWKDHWEILNVHVHDTDFTFTRDDLK